MKNFKLATDTDGITLVTWDMPGRSMNVLDADVLQELSEIIDSTTKDEKIKGVVITSGKDTFCAGADLNLLQTLNTQFVEALKTHGEEAAAKQIFEGSRTASVLYRRIETCGKPWVAAINGTALGGGFELALACHQRICSANPKTRVGLPEIKIGLF